MRIKYSGPSNSRKERTDCSLVVVGSCEHSPEHIRRMTIPSLDMLMKVLHLVNSPNHLKVKQSVTVSYIGSQPVGDSPKHLKADQSARLSLLLPYFHTEVNQSLNTPISESPPIPGLHPPQTLYKISVYFDHKECSLEV